jgi:uncharacterized membrane protein YbhN (UPF0104 family)
MARTLVAGLSRLRDWVVARRRHPALRLVRSAAALGILAVSAWFLWDQIAQGYATLSVEDVVVNPGRLALAWVCIAAATALGAWEWVWLVNALGGNLGLARGMSVHLTANLAKYVPGFVWPYAGKAYLATRRGVPTQIAAASIAGEFGIVYLDGALLLLLCLPFSGLLAWPVGSRLALQGGSVLLTVLVVASVPRAGRWLRRQFEGAGAGGRLLAGVNWTQVTLVVVAVLLTWFLLGVGFSTLYREISPGGWASTLRHVVALAAAMLLGQLAFLVPTGLGVREAVLVAVLGADYVAAPVVLLAVVFRLEMIAGEIVCAAVALAVDRWRQAKRRPGRQDTTNG